MNPRRRDLVLEREDLELKVASRLLVRAAGGTDGAASTVGSRQQRMSDCTLANTPDFLRLDEVRKLEEVTVGQPGWPQVTRVLARLSGFVLVRLPAAPTGLGSWHRAMGALSKECGLIVERLCDCLADDGRISARELAEKAILQEIDEAQERLAELRALAEAVMREGGDTS